MEAGNQNPQTVGQPDGDNGQEEQVNFMMGQARDETTKTKTKADRKIGDDRISEVKGVDGTRNIKNERDKFTVDLRKKKREEMQKQKRRQIQGQQTETNGGSMANGSSAAPGQTAAQAIDFSKIDPATMTIQQAIEFQQEKNCGIEQFTSNIANKMKFDLKDFNVLCQLIFYEDQTTKLLGLIGIRKLLSIENTPPIQAVIDANLTQVFIRLLYHEIPKFQFESAWCLTNIASGSSDHVSSLIEKDVVTHFMQLLGSPHLEVVEQVIWGLGNIAGDCPMTRDCVLKSGALNKIATVLDQAQTGTPFMRNCSWALSNLCRGKPTPDFELVKRAIPSLTKVITENESEEIITDISWALSYLSDGAKDGIEHFLNEGLLRKLIKLLCHQTVSVVIPCLRTIGNILTGDDNQTQFVVDCGLIPGLHSIIDHPKRTVRKEACWVLSNITAGTESQIQQCIDVGIIDKLVHILSHDEMPVKNEAVWALSNTTAGATPEQFLSLVNKGIIQALCSIFKLQDVKMLAVALEGIDNILKCGQTQFLTAEKENQFAIIMENENCLDDLENLQTHQNHEIYEQAVQIIDKYFGEEADVDDNLMQALNSAITNPGMPGQDNNNTMETGTGSQDQNPGYDKLFNI